jgi:hypothetical protein
LQQHLEKFEPNDLNTGQVLDLDVINKAEMEEILAIYNTYENNIMNGHLDLKSMESLNELFSTILNK